MEGMLGHQGTESISREQKGDKDETKVSLCHLLIRKSSSQG